MVKIKSIFPTDKNEIDLVKFINTYQYLSPKDLPYFFNTTYYPKRIAKLIQNNILRRYKRFLVLGEDGYNFMKILGLETNKLRYQEKYANRLKFMSHLAAYFRYSNVTFTPSFLIKDKTAFTESSRKYIGVSNIFGTKYLTYHISNEHTDKYLNSVIYDLQKELKYKNVIIMIDDITRIDFLKFSFGLNSVIICGDTDKALDKIKYLQQINWTKVVQEMCIRDRNTTDIQTAEVQEDNNAVTVAEEQMEVQTTPTQEESNTSNKPTETKPQVSSEKQNNKPVETKPKATTQIETKKVETPKNTENKSTVTSTTETPKKEETKEDSKPTQTATPTNTEKYVRNDEMINKIRSVMQNNESDFMKQYGYNIVVDSSIKAQTNQFTYTESRVINYLKYKFGTIRIYAEDYYKNGNLIMTMCYIL